VAPGGLLGQARGDPEAVCDPRADSCTSRGACKTRKLGMTRTGNKKYFDGDRRAGLHVLGGGRRRWRLAAERLPAAAAEGGPVAAATRVAVAAVAPAAPAAGRGGGGGDDFPPSEGGGEPSGPPSGSPQRRQPPTTTSPSSPQHVAARRAAHGLGGQRNRSHRRGNGPSRRAVQSQNGVSRHLSATLHHRSGDPVTDPPCAPSSPPASSSSPCSRRSPRRRPHGITEARAAAAAAPAGDPAAPKKEAPPGLADPRARSRRGAAGPKRLHLRRRSRRQAHAAGARVLARHHGPRGLLQWSAAGSTGKERLQARRADRPYPRRGSLRRPITPSITRTCAGSPGQGRVAGRRGAELLEDIAGQPVVFSHPYGSRCEAVEEIHGAAPTCCTRTGTSTRRSGRARTRATRDYMIGSDLAPARRAVILLQTHPAGGP